MTICGIEDLVVMEYSKEGSSVKVSELSSFPKPGERMFSGFRVDLKQSNWYDPIFSRFHPIGETRPLYADYKKGVIGVYNRGRIRDLSSMAKDALIAVRIKEFLGR